MRVTGMSGYNYYQYLNALGSSRLGSVLGSNSYQAVQPVDRVSSKTSTYGSDLQSFLKGYQKELLSLESAASKLKTSSSKNVFTDYKAASTDSNVAEVTGLYRLNSTTDIDLKVQSLAQAQQNTSRSSYAMEEVEAGADINLDITGAGGGQLNVSVSSVNANGTAKTYNQMYQEAAKQINAESDLGVKASVVNKEGKVSLVLTAAKMGEDNGFTVSGKAGAAEGIETASTLAQDAVYSVTEYGQTQTFKSSSNTVDLNFSGIQANLKGVGESKIYTGVDEDDVVSAVQDLVDGYNSVQSLLSDNADRGVGAAAHKKSFGLGMASEKELNAIGISYNKEGKLVLDKDALKEALEKDYEGTKSIIGGQFGIAETTGARAERALSEPVQRIASNDLSNLTNQVGSNQYSSNSTFQYFSTFARSGAYNLGNYYAVGMLMNTLV